ncbi:MAG: hypothetical protein WManBPW_02470 [Shewanella algae]
MLAALSRKRLGSDVVQYVCKRSGRIWHERAEHPHWRGLNFYGAMVSCGDRADRSNGTEFPSRDLLFGTVI